MKNLLAPLVTIIGLLAFGVGATADVTVNCVRSHFGDDPLTITFSQDGSHMSFVYSVYKLDDLLGKVPTVFVRRPDLEGLSIQRDNSSAWVPLTFYAWKSGQFSNPGGYGDKTYGPSLYIGVNDNDLRSILTGKPARIYYVSGDSFGQSSSEEHTCTPKP